MAIARRGAWCRRVHAFGRRSADGKSVLCMNRFPRGNQWLHDVCVMWRWGSCAEHLRGHAHPLWEVSVRKPPPGGADRFGLRCEPGCCLSHFSGACSRRPSMATGMIVEVSARKLALALPPAPLGWWLQHVRGAWRRHSHSEHLHGDASGMGGFRTETMASRRSPIVGKENADLQHCNLMVA